jgi:hypothetical protein
MLHFEKSLNYRKDSEDYYCLVFITCISELDKNKLLLATNDIREKEAKSLISQTTPYKNL